MNLPPGMVVAQAEGSWVSDGARVEIQLNGCALYDGEHYNGLDLVQQGQLIGRQDGWQVCPFTSNQMQLVWKKRGFDNLVWKRETGDDSVADRFTAEEVWEVCQKYKISA